MEEKRQGSDEAISPSRQMLKDMRKNIDELR
jgi:hypothetical protein